MVDLEEVLEVLEHLRVELALELLEAPVALRSLVRLEVLALQKHVEIDVLVFVEVLQRVRQPPLLQTLQRGVLVLEVDEGVLRLDRRVRRRLYHAARRLAEVREDIFQFEERHRGLQVPRVDVGLVDERLVLALEQLHARRALLAEGHVEALAAVEDVRAVQRLQRLLRLLVRRKAHEGEDALLAVRARADGDQLAERLAELFRNDY